MRDNTALDIMPREVSSQAN